MTNKLLLIKDDMFNLCFLLSQLWLMVAIICASLGKFIFVLLSFIQVFIWSAMALRELRKKYIL